LEKTKYFNIVSVSYSVNKQPDIMQNYWKNMRENHKYFEMTIGIFFLNFQFFLYFRYFDIIILL